MKACPDLPDQLISSEWLRNSGRATRKRRFAVPLILIVLGPSLSSAAKLRPETLVAWNNYVEQAKARMNARLDGSQHFLWVDEDPDRARRVRSGEILVAPARGNGRTDVANGLIHDWVGAAFFRDTTTEKVFATMEQYDRYKEFYKPTVIDSKLLSRDGGEIRFSMRWLKKALWVTAAMDADYKARYFIRNAKSRYGFVGSTRIQEVVNFSQPSERELPADTGSGFIWRLFSISRFEERDRGVYVELEAMALSRPVPACLAWLVNPVIRQMSQSSLATSLSQTRDAVRSYSQSLVLNHRFRALRHPLRWPPCDHMVLKIRHRSLPAAESVGATPSVTSAGGCGAPVINAEEMAGQPEGRTQRFSG